MLDQLAAQGLRYANGYSNSPVCSPTRFALMTGRYQYHFRGAADEPLHGPNATRSTHGLPPSHQQQFQMESQLVKPRTVEMLRP